MDVELVGGEVEGQVDGVGVEAVAVLSEVVLHERIGLDDQTFFLRELNFEEEESLEAPIVELLPEGEGVLGVLEFNENLKVFFLENHDFVDDPEGSKEIVDGKGVELHLLLIDRHQDYFRGLVEIKRQFVDHAQLELLQLGIFAQKHLLHALEVSELGVDVLAVLNLDQVIKALELPEELLQLSPVHK